MIALMATKIRACFALCVLAAAAPLLAAPPTVGGCQVLPTNHFWNTPIDQLPVDSVNSANWVNSVGPTKALHADWGNKINDGGSPPINEIVSYGIPFSAGPSPTLATITFDVADESDPNPYRIPSNAAVEGGGINGDRHVLSIDTTACKLYELYSATNVSSTTWTASSGAIFDLNSNALRTAGFTSADASGLAIFPGLVRWEEVAAGEIAHAIRFTANSIWGSAGSGQHKYIWPARHWSGDINNPLFPPMGARFRLKASFNISAFDSRTQVILRAFKKYGMVLVDGGSNWYFQGVSSTNWPDIVLSQLNNQTLIKGGDFEVVDTSLLQINVNSALAVQVPGAPANLAATAGNTQVTLNFTAPADNGGSPIVTSALYPAYKATCNPGAKTGTGNTSPLIVAGLTNGTQYTCTVAAANVTGVGVASTGVNVTPRFPFSSAAILLLLFDP